MSTAELTSLLNAFGRLVCSSSMVGLSKPSADAKLGTSQNSQESSMLMETIICSVVNQPSLQVKVDGDPLMETRILEASLAKLCSLLAVGFGDAGGEVIGNNIKSGGDLNPMIPGHKILGIYGFCDIRQFTDATEVLQASQPHPLRKSETHCQEVRLRRFLDLGGSE